MFYYSHFCMIVNWENYSWMSIGHLPFLVFLLVFFTHLYLFLLELFLFSLIKSKKKAKMKGKKIERLKNINNNRYFFV